MIRLHRPGRWIAPPRWAALPRRTVRLRLTALYGVLLLLSGTMLLALTYALAANWLPWPSFQSLGRPSAAQPPGLRASAGAGSSGAGTASSGAALHDRMSALQAQLASQKAMDLHDLLLGSAIALAVLALISVALGWWAAGRVLRPLRSMTESARRISEDNLSARLAVPGPPDELKDLADTLDGLFARLEGAFEAQRRFVANASHELRTPLARARTVLEVALDDPDATVDSLKAAGRRALASGEQQGRLIEALLLLARSQRGLDQRVPFDLADLAAEATAQLPLDGLRLDSKLRSAPTTGDPRLARRLVANLLDNAVRHNVPGGRITASTETRGGRAVLVVVNSGPVVNTHDLPGLFEPFRRPGEPRTGRPDGLGLGLSIVSAIAAAHGAVVGAAPLAGGGLRIEISFPSAATPGTAPPQPLLPRPAQPAEPELVADGLGDVEAQV